MEEALGNMIAIVLYSIFFTYAAVVYFIPKMMKHKVFIIDKYKRGLTRIPTMGGIPMFVGIMAALALSQLLIHEEIIGKLYVFYFIATIYLLYGTVDDLFGFKKRYDKIPILMILSLPIGSLISHSTVTAFGHVFYFYGFFPILIAPLFIMVVANLVNVYSGFNGMATGLTFIMFIFAGIKSYMLYKYEYMLFFLPIFGAMFVMYTYNIFPARLHEGNSGAFLMGSTLGAFLVLNKLEWFGFIMLLPHTVNFIMDTVVLGILRIPDVKFGKLRKDNTIEAPATMRFKSFKFMLTHFFKLTENQTTFLLYVPTVVFGVIAVVYA